MQFGALHVGKSPKKHADSSSLNPLDLLGKAIEQVGRLFSSPLPQDGSESPAQAPGPEPAAEDSAPEPDAESVDALRAKLDEAVREERYEDAAKLRDRINSLSK